jgi:O-antigen/teichoic acid export membrane protein
MSLENLTKRLSRPSFIAFGSLVLAQAVTMVCGLSATVIWARWMPQEAYGGFKIAFNIVTLVGTFCLLGTGQAVLLSAAQRMDGNLQRLIRSKLWANFGGTCLILVAAAYYEYFARSSHSIALALAAAAFLFPVYNLSDTWTSWLNGRAHFSALAFGRILASALPLLGLAGAAVLGVIELWILVVVYFVLLGIQNLFMLAKVYSTRENDRIDSSILSNGRHSNMSMMFGSLIALDVVILNHISSANEVAVYALALVFPELIKSLFAIVNQYFSPRLSNGDSIPVIWANLRLKFAAVCIFFIFIAIAGWVCIPSLFPLLFSDKYSDSVDYAKWLWVFSALSGATSFLGVALLATKRLIFIYGVFVGHPMLLLVMYLIFSSDGAAGMVLARIVGTSALGAFYVSGFLFLLMSDGRKHGN